MSTHGRIGGCDAEDHVERLSTAVACFVVSNWPMVAAWALMVRLQAGVFPCAVRSIGQVFREREQTRVSGCLGAGMLAGAAIAPVLRAGCWSD
jgi:MFS family permease